MIPLESYFDKVWPHKAGKYLVVEEPANKILSSKWTLLCVDCNKTIKSKAGDLYRGQKPCACGIKYYNTHERKMEKLEPLFLSKGFSFVDPEFKISTSHEKFELYCSTCQKSWLASFDTLINSGHGCYNCTNQNRSKSDYEFLVKQALEKVDLQFESFMEYGKRLSFRSKLEVSCKSCSHKFLRTIGKVLKSSNGCPSCVKYGFKENGNSVLYLIKVQNVEDKNYFYKYGITNDLTSRIYQYRSSGQFIIKIMSEWFYSDSSKCKAHEKQLKTIFKPFVLRNEFPDGYTETIGEQDVLSFFKIQTNQYRF